MTLVTILGDLLHKNISLNKLKRIKYILWLNSDEILYMSYTFLSLMRTTSCIRHINSYSNLLIDYPVYQSKIMQIDMIIRSSKVKRSRKLGQDANMRNPSKIINKSFKYKLTFLINKRLRILTDVFLFRPQQLPIIETARLWLFETARL